MVMAEAARNVANLALLRDVAKAVAFYQRALTIDPEHIESAARNDRTIRLVRRQVRLSQVPARRLHRHPFFSVGPQHIVVNRADI